MDALPRILLAACFVIDLASSVSFSPEPTSKSLDVPDGTGFSPKPTSVRGLGLHKGLRRGGGEEIGFNTCGWIGGDAQYPYTCDDANACVWEPQYQVVGCCLDPSDCLWYTSCVPYSEGTLGCDESCQAANDYTTFCTDPSYGLCVSATFGGPGSYSWLSCTDTASIQSIAITMNGDSQTPINLPRYSSAYFYSTAVTTGSGSSSTSTPSSSTTDATNWIAQHKSIVIGAAAGVGCILLALFVFCCCCRRTRTRVIVPTRAGGYVVAGQQHGRPEAIPLYQQQQYQSPNPQSSYEQMRPQSINPNTSFPGGYDEAPIYVHTPNK